MITCWNGRELLEQNLPSVLAASENPKNKIEEIIVVDDGSTDESVEYVNKCKVQKLALSLSKGAKCKVRLVKHERNLGYSATCNTGVKEARGDLVTILNLDVIPSENFLEAALPHFDDEKVFAVSFNEGKFGPGKLVWKKGFLEIESSEIPVDIAKTDWPSGGSSIFKKDIWEKLGGMDELFLPFYFEDIDLGIRARRLGFKCLWEPKAKVEHQHGATINKDNFRMEFVDSIKQRNQLLLTWKNIDSKKLLFSHLENLLKRCCFHPGYLKIVYLAGKRKLFK